MSVNSDRENPDPPPVPQSDNERLIHTLQSCFQDLITKQEEHADKFHRAVVEALRPQAQTTDTKTAFWNAYMKLADEHDKEFQQKYSTDLDTSLIFAGLFSAISSAFIIQIQPDIQTPVATASIAALILLYISLFVTLLAALLAVLGKQWVMYYNAAGSRGSVEQRGLERQRKLDGLRQWKFDMVLQSFPLLLQLALLLFSMALSINLWSIHRGVALVVLVMTLAGFSAYLFLLATAIFSADSPFQNPLAPLLVQVFKSFFVNQTTKNLAGSLRDKWEKTSSFFQRKAELLPTVASDSSSSVVVAKAGPPENFYESSDFAPPSPEGPAVLWVLQTSTDPLMIETAAEIAVGCQWPVEIDVTTPMARVLETYAACFERLSNGWQMRIPEHLTHRALSCGRAYCSFGLIQQASSIDEHVETSLHYSHKIHPWLVEDTNHHLLFSQLSNLSAIAGPVSGDFDLDWDDPHAVQWVLHIYPSVLRCIYATESRLALETELSKFLGRFSPQARTDLPINQQIFTNYLCSVITLCSPVRPRVMLQYNKSLFRDSLIAHLLTALSVTPKIHPSFIVKIINTTVQLQKQSIGRKYPLNPRSVILALFEATCQFCRSFPRQDGWLDVVISAAGLARVDESFVWEKLFSRYPQVSPNNTKIDEFEDVQWIYLALEHIQQKVDATHVHSIRDHGRVHAIGERDGNFHAQASDSVRDAEEPELDNDAARAVDSLLQLLATRGKIIQKPPQKCLHIILRTLTVSAFETMELDPAFLVLHRMRTWFLDSNFAKAIHENNIWPSVSRLVARDPRFTGWRYFEIVSTVAESAQWQPYIHRELYTWLTIYSDLHWYSWFPIASFNSLTRKIWVPSVGDKHLFASKSEEAWSLTLLALTAMWEDGLDFKDFFSTLDLARYTVSAAISPFEFSFQGSSELRAALTPGLGKNLMRAADKVETTVPEIRPVESSSDSPPADAVADMKLLASCLRALGQEIRTHFSSSPGEVKVGDLTKEYGGWGEMSRILRDELDHLDISFAPLRK